MTNPFHVGYWNEHDLQSAGFKKLGRNVQIAKNCTIVGIENITSGDNVRIDGYCTLVAAGTGFIELGSYIHIGSYCLLSGNDGIKMADFTCLSHAVKLYSRSDDYSGNALTNPTVPAEYLNVNRGPVIIEKHRLVGSGSIVLPNITIHEGSAVGALSLVNTDVASWSIYAGIPARRIKERSKKLLELEASLRQQRS